MKTVYEWAQELPENVREKFLANVVEQEGERRLEYKALSLSNAIEGSFTWHESPEGFDFWNDIYSENR